VVEKTDDPEKLAAQSMESTVSDGGQGPDLDFDSIRARLGVIA
jgi:hypothetical protein